MDAVHTLVGGEIQQMPAYRSATVTAHVQKEPEKKTFSLPWARQCAASAVSYLQQRGISSDILVEGDMLCHCLRGSDRYWDRIQTHESYILFLRRASALDTPYYTLEVEPDGTVRQKRTKFDRQEDDIKEAVNFLTEWQGVLSKRLTRSDRKKAANSRVLREQEFEQMRQDNVLIRTGDLAGRRLVDVLIADLLEAAA